MRETCWELRHSLGFSTPSATGLVDRILGDTIAEALTLVPVNCLVLILTALTLLIMHLSLALSIMVPTLRLPPVSLTRTAPDRTR